MGLHNNALGAHGEDLAVRYLQGKGLRVLERNWRCRFGEIDVVARDGETVAFIEVKTRRGLGYGYPIEAVTTQKQRRIRQLAALWREHTGTRGRARFDVVSVLLDGWNPPVLEHHEGVF
jgi:putative endonuclease